MEPATQPIRRALLSVWDKRGLAELAQALVQAGAELISSGGTAAALRETGITVRDVSDLTGFSEMLDGRVKTLHPLVHAGILARRDRADHLEQLAALGAAPIDLVVVNLYPFSETFADGAAAVADAIEQIDIGGPALLRAAAKNCAAVAVVCDPDDYAELQGALAGGGTDLDLRLRLARKAFEHTAAYDAAIARAFGRIELAAGGPQFGVEPPLPDFLPLALARARGLRYGENPHQQAALYRDASEPVSGLGALADLQGKELSFNNLLDLDAAVRLAYELPRPGAAVIKHGSPCGVALGASGAEAYVQAREADPVSAFGGVVALNMEVGAELARELASTFLEVVAAPGFDAAARGILAAKKKLRLIELPLAAARPRGADLRRLMGAYLVQSWDHPARLDPAQARAAGRAPSDEEWQALRFAWQVVRHVRSNAIVVAGPRASFGIGGGQVSRVDAVRIALEKAGAKARSAALASDAFFPFRDSVDLAAAAGVGAIVAPGGSLRDEEVAAAAREHGIALIFTSERHFRH
ncbi:MAG TPA: bifunctional phosphoribosylaminoimidazolecarboxamide formyltransferase/IMP cyclohydrolase [Acidobacteriota bacterium]